MVTQKDFKAIAEIISHNDVALTNCDGDYYEGGRFDATNCIASELANYFKQENPKFGRERFFKACGL